MTAERSDYAQGFTAAYANFPYTTVSYPSDCSSRLFVFFDWEYRFRRSGGAWETIFRRRWKQNLN